MIVVPATDKHVEDARAWMRARGSMPWSREALLPANGFVVEGVAAVWIYSVSEVRIALLESLVANPDTAEDVRDEAIDAVVTEAIAYARFRGARTIVSVTGIAAVIERAGKHGFVISETGVSVLVSHVGG